VKGSRRNDRHPEATNLVYALLGEHAVLYELFGLIEKTDPSPGAPTFEDLRIRMI